MVASIWVGEVRTGRRITQIPVSGGSWGQVHRRGGDVTIQVPLLAKEFARYEQQVVGGTIPGPLLYPGPAVFPSAGAPIWRPGQGLRREFLSALDPARCFLAVVEGDRVHEAGPIWVHDLPGDSMTLAVRAAGMRSIFDHRRVMGLVASGTEAAAWSVTHDGVSLGTIAKRLIQQAMDHTHGDLPIDLPDDETVPAGARTRTYYGYDLGVLGQRLDELMNVDGGPDLALEPYITPDRLGIRWRLRTGTEADPLLHQHSGDWMLDAQVPQGAVHSIGVHVDATGVAGRSWVTGAGSQSALVMAWADDDTLTSRGWPLLEVAESRHTIEDPATAASWASANLAAAARPWSTWTVQVAASSLMRNGELMRPGDFASVWVPGDHPYLRWKVPAGRHRARVLEIKGALGSPLATLSLAPVMDVR